MESVQNKVSVHDSRNSRPVKKITGYRVDKQRLLLMLLVFAIFIASWQLAANYYNSKLLLPTPFSTAQTFFEILKDPSVLRNLMLTLERVLIGFSYAAVIGVTIGFFMGYSKKAMYAMDPLISSIRQVPIMAWIPLTIVWFGLGDGPTVFLIAMAGVFPFILNTIVGVRSISKDYYHAARSMGADSWSIFAHVIVPGSLPDILTGARLALGSGWMSVICAEFIATSAGFGYAMVEAQTRMETDKLLALMVMGAIVGYLLDRGIQEIQVIVARWRFS